MTKSYRIRTKVGTDQNIRINVNQDFDFLEILSLKLRQEDIYTRFCADYGVVVGRVITNGGYGVPNANVSIFVPLSDIDSEDPVISTLYPYKNIDQKNEDGYRYNLLPYQKEYEGHTPTGTFPTREDVLTRKEVLEVYEKYYKYTVKTNDSGDFMIVGVPLGNQKIVMDLDLSNIGCFSLRPADLIRMGMGAEGQFDGQQFRSSTDLASLPQIVNASKDIDVTPFWGETEICNIGITRSDFDLRDLGIEIKPQATFMGSIFSTADEDFLKTNCKPKKEVGNLCDLVTSPGRILAIRQTINYDDNGRPILETYNIEEGGKVIDSDGTWLIEVPMNLEYVTTNEFGEQILSNDPSVGIPTKAKYRFRVQYQNEGGVDNNSILRADYLIPNIKEWGWGVETLTNEPPIDNDQQLKSYAFSLDWEDYGDVNTTQGLNMIQEAIDCVDRFYEMNYNKVYTVSSHIDRWKWGFNRSRHLGIKEITDRGCTTTTNRFPVNDGVRNFDFLFFLFNIIINLLTPVIISLIILSHVLAFIYPIFVSIVNLLIKIINVIIYGLCKIVDLFGDPDCKKEAITPLKNENPFKRIPLPMMSYPDCEACSCEDVPLEGDSSATQSSIDTTVSTLNDSLLANTNSVSSFVEIVPGNQSANSGALQVYAGYQEQNTGSKFIGVPMVTLGQQEYSGAFNTIISPNVNISQSMNLANLRQRYFDQENYIQTTVRNTIPNTNTVVDSESFEDSTLVLFCDPGTISNLTPGKLFTFYNPSNVNDPNVSGLTIANQFNTNNITGSTPYNSNSLVTRQVTYVDINGSTQTKNLYLKITEDGKEYKFKGGIEYFQILTGGTVTQFSGLTNNSGVGLLKKYLFNRVQYFYYPNTSQLSTLVNPAMTYLINYLSHEILILSRGVDPYTDKQNIRYDLSPIFGYTFGNGPAIEGEYYLNVPIQPNSNTGNWFSDYKTPQSHITTSNNNNEVTPVLYHEPFGFDVDPNLFTAFTNNSSYFYNSTDRSVLSFVAEQNDNFNLGSYVTAQNMFSQITTNGGTNVIGLTGIPNTSLLPQGNVEGGTLMASPSLGALGNSNARVYSPAYNTTNPTPITITNNNRLVFRSDRLPTSDQLQTNGNNSFSLHLNNSFSFYEVTEEGTILIPSVTITATDTNNNAADAQDDGGQFTDTVLETLTCERMVPFSCYQDSGTAFSVLDPCSANQMGKNGQNRRVQGGCYMFVDNPLIFSIKDDILYFAEWKSRFRMMFGACRGVFSHVFQNNWVNGSLYMFGFKKASRFSATGELKRYKYCGDPQSMRAYQGPIFYSRGGSNGFFYRSTPYNPTTDEFVGQYPKKITPLSFITPPYTWESAGGDTTGYKGMNTKNLFFPTTIMDLGPRDQFTKEICFNPQFEGFLMDTLLTTSYNDTADILSLFIVSRLINSSFLQQILGAQDASINTLFNRSEDRIDGDIAQLWSINSEYGVFGFSDDVYDDNDITIVDDANGNPVLGIFFSANTFNRNLQSPGVLPYTTFSYPTTQEVPMYRWNQNDSGAYIFGSRTNNWYTDGPFYSEGYQDMDINGTPYFQVSNGNNTGYIFNFDSNQQQTAFRQTQPSDYTFVVGGPRHFYFGLNKGASALNRYITKYIFNQ